MMMSEAVTVRRIQFPWAQPLKAWWNPSRPEFSQSVNSASLAVHGVLLRIYCFAIT
jgi:hypothetical protein